ncbi:DNA primase [Candidatus Providencia siddallii]|uniref:DNA primase n=1 Tax=Candidatus Providencia siddallii TaxID=1715285 RepID=A0ABP1CDN0_9GAMM
MIGQIPHSFINELLTKTNIINLINSKIPLKKKGKNYNAFCPFHNEKTPSFFVNKKKQIYHCFGCGVHGNAIDFLINYNKLNFVEAIEELSSLHGINLKYIKGEKINKTILHKRTELYYIMKKINYFYQNSLKNTSSKKLKIYLKIRGLTKEIIDYFSIGYAPFGWNNLLNFLILHIKNYKCFNETGMFILNDNGKIYDRFRERIIFPIRDYNGRIIAFGGRTLDNSSPKYLNSAETNIFHKRHHLFGLYEAIQKKYKLEKILIVEGYMDVITLTKYNINYAVSSLGTSTTYEQIKLLFRFTNTIIYCYDGDQAGKIAAWRALKNSLTFLNEERKLNFIFLPSGEDPDSLIQKEGKKSFEKRILTSKTFSNFLFDTLISKTNLITQDDKINFANITLNLIKKIPNKTMRFYITQKLGFYIGIPDITQVIAITNKKNNIKINYKTPKFKLTTMRILITLLLQNPIFSKLVPSFKKKIYTEIPGFLLFKQLVDFCNSLPEITTGQLLEKYRNNKLLKLLEKLAFWNDICTEETAKKLFIDTLNHLFKNILNKRFEYLMAKERTQKLTFDERKEVYSLILLQTKINKKTFNIKT